MNLWPFNCLYPLRDPDRPVKIQSEESQPATRPSDADLRLMVAEAAYYRALARGFAGGNADEDWYAAEAEIEQAYA